MTNALLNDFERRWAAISPLLTIRNERQYDKAVALLNELLSKVGIDEQHPLYGLLDTLGTLIHAYEEEQYKFPDSDGAEMLQYMMDEHGLTQSDLPEAGTQGVVSEILRGKRKLNVRQIRSLANRFHVSPAVFI